MQISLTAGRPGSPGVDVRVRLDAATPCRALASELAAGMRALGLTTVPLGASAGEIMLRVVDPASGLARIVPGFVAVADAGLWSGMWVEPVVIGPLGAAEICDPPPVGWLTAVDGPGTGQTWPVWAGANLIGRDAHCAVALEDHTLSRRHACLDVRPDGAWLTDLGSTNGSAVAGTAVTAADGAVPVTGPLRLGSNSYTLTVTREPESLAWQEADGPGVAAPRLMRSARVTPVFAPQTVEFPPAPPVRAAVPLPWLAGLAPVALGVAMFLVTGSPLSLLVAALVPVMLVATSVENKWRAGRQRRVAQALYRERLAHAGSELARLRSAEVAVRNACDPSAQEVAELVLDVARQGRDREGLIWSRGAAEVGGGRVRLGMAHLDSLVTVTRPPAGEDADSELEGDPLAGQRQTSQPVPVTTSLEAAGNLGVVGAEAADETLAAVIVQLAGLHPPSELRFAVVAPEAGTRWAWLEWLVRGERADSVTASTAQEAEELCGVLEAEIAQRTGAHAAKLVSAPSLHRQPTWVVVVVEVPGAALARVLALAARGPDVGIHLVWRARSRHELPAECRVFVDLADTAASSGPPYVGLVEEGRTVVLAATERIGLPMAETAARVLARFDEVERADASESTGMTDQVRLTDLVADNVLTDWRAVARRWQGQGRQDARGGAAERGLGAVVGMGRRGPVALRLRDHGPHALVAGTTGAGKSGLLEAWIYALAATWSPHEVTFLLIDYKGGAAFGGCVGLPHTVGLVTDLTGPLAARVLTCLRAEVRRRERLLAELGASDLVALERRGEPRRPPALVIVIDEFATLVADVPAFIDGVVDIARRGRSLGLHLIVATQRPAGVISEDLRANTSLRVALRTADEDDSRDVVGSSVAASFDPSRPGVAVAKLGTGPLTQFQVAHLGWRAPVGGARETVTVVPMKLSGMPHWPGAHPVSTSGETGPTDAERLTQTIGRAFAARGLARPARPWLPALPAVINLDTLLAEGWQAQPAGEMSAGEMSAGEMQEGEAPAERGGGAHGEESAMAARSVERWPLAVVDRPAEQRQDVWEWDPAQQGHLLVVGGPGSGRSSALCAAVYAAAWRARDSARGGRSGSAPSVPHFYVIDAGGGGLCMLDALPIVGAVVNDRDEERLVRMVARFTGEIEMRTRRGLAASARRAIVLVIDGLDVLLDSVLEAGMAVRAGLAGILEAGRRVGVYVAATIARPGGLPREWETWIGVQVMLRLASPTDRILANLPKGVLEGAVPAGRGFTSGEEIQLATPSGARSAEDVALAVRALGEDLTALRIDRAPPVRALASDIPVGALPARDVAGRPVIGLDGQSLEPVGLRAVGLISVWGPRGSGRTTAVATLAAAWQRADPRRRLTLVAGRGLDGALAQVPWDRVLATPEAIGQYAAECDPDRDIAVVADAHAFADSPAHDAVAGLIRRIRGSTGAVLVEMDPAIGAGAWKILAELAGPRAGLFLQPDESDALRSMRVMLPRLPSAQRVPGRGFLVAEGQTLWVQVARLDVPGALTSRAP